MPSSTSSGQYFLAGKDLTTLDNSVNSSWSKALATVEIGN